MPGILNRARERVSAHLPVLWRIIVWYLVVVFAIEGGPLFFLWTLARLYRTPLSSFAYLGYSGIALAGLGIFVATITDVALEPGFRIKNVHWLFWVYVISSAVGLCVPAALGIYADFLHRVRDLNPKPDVLPILRAQALITMIVLLGCAHVKASSWKRSLREREQREQSPQR